MASAVIDVDSFMADLQELEADTCGNDAVTSPNDCIVNDWPSCDKQCHDLMLRVQALVSNRHYIAIAKEDLKPTTHDAAMLNGHDTTTTADADCILVTNCTTLLVEIEKLIDLLHNFVRDKYKTRFPELESILNNPIDFAKVVKRIGNETNISMVDLHGIVLPTTLMVVSMALAITHGKTLSEEMLGQTLEACEKMLELDGAKQSLIVFLESKMVDIAPNLCAIVGSNVAAMLLAAAGGLAALACMPSCNLQCLGANKRNIMIPRLFASHHLGFIAANEIVHNTPPMLRYRACRLIATKATLATRIDQANAVARSSLSREHQPNASVFGKSMREQIIKTIQKWQDYPRPQHHKPLPVPIVDNMKKGRRGGCRMRKRRERYAMTNMRKLADRIWFGIPEECSFGEDNYGMLGQARKIHISVDNKLKSDKKWLQGYSFYHTF